VFVEQVARAVLVLMLGHELHHVWQSRALGDSFGANYTQQGILSLLMGNSFISQKSNYFETVGQNSFYHWWGKR
jgi:hypothetical protein